MPPLLWINFGWVSRLRFSTNTAGDAVIERRGLQTYQRFTCPGHINPHVDAVLWINPITILVLVQYLLGCPTLFLLFLYA
jgi:hypothetical protein